jgi:hypothetical protein
MRFARIVFTAWQIAFLAIGSSPAFAKTPPWDRAK